MVDMIENLSAPMSTLTFLVGVFNVFVKCDAFNLQSTISLPLDCNTSFFRYAL